MNIFSRIDKLSEFGSKFIKMSKFHHLEQIQSLDFCTQVDGRGQGAESMEEEGLGHLLISEGPIPRVGEGLTGAQHPRNWPSFFCSRLHPCLQGE